jgi:hypothetical protein
MEYTGSEKDKDKTINRIITSRRSRNERFAVQMIFYVGFIFPLSFVLITLFSFSIYTLVALIILVLPVVLIINDIKKDDQYRKIASRSDES